MIEIKELVKELKRFPDNMFVQVGLVATDKGGSTCLIVTDYTGKVVGNMPNWIDVHQPVWDRRVLHETGEP